MGDITASNSVLSIGVDGIYPTPVQLQGFAQDDAYSVDSIDVSENMIGVDGIKSSGFIFTMKEMKVTLQADSQSADFWETWYNAQQSTQSLFAAFGTLFQPSIGRAYTLTNGTLKGFVAFAQAKKILQPRTFSIVWQEISGAPAGF